MSSYDLSYIFKAIDEFTPTMKKMQESIANFEKQTVKAENRFKKFSATMKTVGRNLFTHLTLPLIGAAAYALKNADNLEVMRIKLEAVAGSAANAARVMSYVKENAMATGLSPEALTTTARKLFAAGYGMDQINEKMRQMSILAIGAGQSVESVTTIIARMAGRKTASGLMLTRLTNMGIPIIPAFQKFWGVSDAGMMALTRKQLDYKKLIEPVLDSMTKKGSAFAESYDKMLKTAGRSTERIHNTLRFIAADFGEAAMNVFGINDGMAGLADKLKELEPRIAKFLKTHAGLIKMAFYIGLAAAALGVIAIILANIEIVIGGAIVAGVIYLYNKFSWLRDIVKYFYNDLIAIKNVVMDIVHGIANFGTKLNNFVQQSVSGEQETSMTQGFLNRFSAGGNVGINITPNGPINLPVNQGGKQVSNASFNVGKTGMLEMGWDRARHVLGAGI